MSGAEALVRESFARQGLMRTFGATIIRVGNGVVEITAPIRPDSSQQDGFAHGGLAWAIGDSACGYAAVSAFDEPMAVLTVEMKINFLAPAKGESLTAKGEVIRRGSRIVITRAEIYARQGEEEVHIATMLGTMAMRAE